MALEGQLSRLGISSSRRKDNIKMVLKRLERGRIQGSIQRLEYGMDSPGFEHRQTQKMISLTSKPSRPALGTTRTPIQCVVGIFPRGKAAGV
jgi:hypothetical protein